MRWGLNFLLATPGDYSIIGTVVAISLVIMILSGLALYVAFRVRETFREERGTGMRVVKLVFLIGLLFLSGGIFYFFAGGVRSNGPSTSSISSLISTISNTGLQRTTTRESTIIPNDTVTVTTTGPLTTSSASQISSESQSTSGISSTLTSSSSSATSSKPATTTTDTAGQHVTMTLSYPSKAVVGSTFDLSITVINSGPGTANSVAIQAGGVLSTFVLVTSNYPTSGNVIVVGGLAPGGTVVDLRLMAPSQPQQFSGTITLTYQEMSGPSTAPVTIRVAQS